MPPIAAELVPPPLFWDWDLEHDVMTWVGGLGALVELPAGVSSRSWWEERIHPADREAVHEGLASLRRGAQTRWTGVYRVRGRGDVDVEVRDRAALVELDGRPHRLVGVIELADVAVAEPSPDLLERLDLSERRFELFIASLPLLAWEADATGWIDFYNQRWYEYTGTTSHEMEGWGWARVHDPLDLPRMLRVWRQALQNGQAWEDAFRLRRGSDGQLRWHLSRAFPLKDGDGRVVRWFGTNTDIHDQRLALEEREHLLRDARSALRAKDEFLAVVSHELRTPLSVVLNWSQMLRRGVDPERLDAGLEKVERNARMLGRLIEDLLDVSRITSGKLEIERQVVDLREPVERAVEALRPHAEGKQVRLELTPSIKCPSILGCPQRLQQIASNLIDNAIKFSEPGHRVQVALIHEPDTVVLKVHDEGVGLAPAHLALIFERFGQANASITRRHGGLGLGLYVVRNLVELHGGTITVESMGLGLGSTFTVRIPLTTAAARIRESPAPTSSVPIPVTLIGRKVLVVDDDPESREVLAVVLIRCGASVTLAGSVAEALEQLRADIPDVLISDIAMPVVDGYGLLERLRSSTDPRWRAIKILALTAHASVQDRASALRAGFDDYLSKPFDAATLSHRIAELARVDPELARVDPGARSPL